MNYHRRTVREWRAYRKYTKTYIAHNLGVHISTYTRMEDKPQSISVLEALDLAKVFDCAPRDIIFFEEKPNTMLDISRLSNNKEVIA